MSSEPSVEPIVIKYHAGRSHGVLYDADLNFRTLDELREWAARGIEFTIVDAGSGEDLTRIMLAHWDEGSLVDPMANRVPTTRSSTPR
jgi:polyhydroxyalkanoate synthesis regulator protein